MLHIAILVEQQLKRKSTSRLSYGAGASKPSFQKEERPHYLKEFKQTTIPKEEAKPYATTKDNKGKAKITISIARDVRCFKCQGIWHYKNECSNRRVMILLDNGEIEYENEKPESFSSSRENEEKPSKGELLVAMRSLSIQTKAEDQDQRENLFHTRCHVQGKFCSLIIDEGSNTNVANDSMAKKLGLKVRKYPYPYKL